MSAAIKIENLSKTYSIAHQERRDPSLRAVIERRLRRAAARLSGRRPGAAGGIMGHSDSVVTHEEFRALDNISLEVPVGERIGIVGANGAGKSTLLKILSRITEPTSGRVSIRGRVSSLLEVGTGFHPELTGRENIYLNGAILGMPRVEIRKKFDEIVAFSEVEKFIDTPVKFYSSGMYVRLAFSVSAHLDPEILILDEVLAVGDARFQRKCLGQMRRFSETGRTVLFVSHNASAVAQFCSSAIHLEHGRIKHIGPAQQIVEAYQAQSLASVEISGPGLVARSAPSSRIGDDIVEIEQVAILDAQGRPNASLALGDEASIAITFKVLQRSPALLVPNIHIRSADSIHIGVSSPADTLIGELDAGRYTAYCRLPAHLLNNGVYTVQAAISSFNTGQIVHCDFPGALTFEIVDDLSDKSRRHGYLLEIPGVIRPYLDWTIGAAA